MSLRLAAPSSLRTEVVTEFSEKRLAKSFVWTVLTLLVVVMVNLGCHNKVDRVEI